MRLTLRTLLAYLDDRLSPGDARELGQKVTKSPFAKELADRIREVLRKRRLAADSANQKTIDANLVAEYLDDQLTPELVGLIEKEILASDHCLAEVAASHQILGMLNDPAEIDDKLRNRLYAMDPAAGSESEKPAAATTGASQEGEWKPLVPQSTAQRRSPMVLLLVMVLGWLVLLATDSDLFDQSARHEDVAVTDAPPGRNDDADSDAAPDNQADSAAVPSESAADPGSTVASAADSGGAASADTAPADASAEDVAGDRPTSDQSASPGTEATATADSDKVPPPPEAIDLPAPVLFEVVDENGMLMLSNEDSDEWVWAANLAFGPGDNWATPLSDRVAGIAAPFRVSVGSEQAGWKAEIHGSTLFRLVTEGGSGLQMLDGKAVIVNPSDSEPATFVLDAGGQRLTIQLPSKDTVVGIAVSPLPAPFDVVPQPIGNQSLLSLLPVDSACTVQVFAADSDVSVSTEAGDTSLVIARGTAALWTTNSDIGPQAEPSLTVPAWVFKAADPPVATVQATLDKASVILRQEPTMADGVRSLSENRNPELATYAVKVPALTRNIDELLPFLIEAEEDVVRQEAIRGLQAIVLQDAESRSRVATALELRLSNVEIGNVMKLLAGVTPTAAEDRSISAWLIDMLQHNRVAVRELAIFNLEAVTGERYNFFAGDDSGRRDAAVRRWKRFLGRNDGRLKTPVEQ